MDKIQGGRIIFSGSAIVRGPEELTINEDGDVSLTFRFNQPAAPDIQAAAGNLGKGRQHLLIEMAPDKLSINPYSGSYGDLDENLQLRFVVHWLNDVEKLITYMVYEAP